MRKHYRIDKGQDYRKIRLEVLVASMLSIGLIVGGAFVIFDLNKNKVVIDESKNKAILGSVEPYEDPFKLYETNFYKVKVPSDWKQVNNPELIINGRKFYPERYQGVSGDHVGRRLDIYRDSIPNQLGIDKVVAVVVSKNKIEPIKTSPQCYKFTTFPKEQPGDNYPSQWEGIDFTCMTSEITNVLGAVEKTQDIGARLFTEFGTTNYLLVYTDHGSRLDNSIFYDILKSFEAK